MIDLRTWSELFLLCLFVLFVEPWRWLMAVALYAVRWTDSGPKLFRPKVVVVDGIIAAGKTTLIQVLEQGLTKRGLRVRVVKEPVERWTECGILNRFYQDPGRWGYHFQTKVFVDRIEAGRRALNSDSQVDVYLLERCIHSDRIFMEMLFESKIIDHLEISHYRQWADLWSEMNPFQIDLHLYLRPSLEACMARVAERGREAESQLTLDYQTRLMDKHDRFIQSQKHPVLTLATDENFRDNLQTQTRVVETVLSHLSRV